MTTLIPCIQRMMRLMIVAMFAMALVSCGKSKENDASVLGYRAHAKSVRFNFQAYHDTPSNDELSAYLIHAIKDHHGVRANVVFADIAASYYFGSGLKSETPAKNGEAQAIENTTVASTELASEQATSQSEDVQTELTDEESIAQLGIEALAADIIHTANCFNLDVYYFVGLIQHESAGFNPIAKSPTGAIGFTQMTGIAVEEVNHQLGQFGTDQAPQQAIDFYTNVVQSCLQVRWFPHWAGRKISEQKKDFKINFSAALAYGALYLHEKIALRLRGKTGDPDETYRDAFNGYNGAGAAEVASHERNSIAAVEAFVDFVNGYRFENGGPLVINQATERLVLTGLPLEAKNAVFDPGAVLNIYNSSPLVAEARSLLVFRGFLTSRSGYYDSAMARAICDQIGFENPVDENEYCAFGAPLTSSMWNDMQVLSDDELVQLMPEASEFIGISYPDLEIYDGWKQNRENKPAVRLLQSILKARGYVISVDGAYGPGTQRTLVSYIESVNKMMFATENLGYDGSTVDILVWNRLFQGKQVNAN